ncbi:hypothetical protein AVEN_127692-1 [Araneus ventricosus]|uniref:Uncharacterized protein n=1 Tax=Araneus ventricosus TaxID=182803 RepID=A0A4Y2AZE5_ARAVE|nr:hypothetical protein AVEN_115773-1 [Araneus ventricosus]GBL84558.1 hypothetical protein AVEN_79860-1 [Araneus ventricosus]GBL85489.1 hypothetical protein AVEN_247173-1 [Araneus ventricosus]GBL85890.1 hypothetical protein AVEN_127692-1 [Araneus ventricosus]
MGFLLKAHIYETSIGSNENFNARLSVAAATVRGTKRVNHLLDTARPVSMLVVAHLSTYFNCCVNKKLFFISSMNWTRWTCRLASTFSRLINFKFFVMGFFLKVLIYETSFESNEDFNARLSVSAETVRKTERVRHFLDTARTV